MRWIVLRHSFTIDAKQKIKHLVKLIKKDKDLGTDFLIYISLRYNYIVSLFNVTSYRSGCVPNNKNEPCMTP